MPRKKSADQSSKADLEDAQALLRLHNSNDISKSIFAVEAQSNFSWSDDSWDPMDREIVAIYKSRYDTELAIKKNAVPIGEGYRAQRPTFDFFEIPVGEDVPIQDGQLLYLVFATKYHGISHYSDSEGRIHDSYRTDGTGKPIKAFINRDSARLFVDELNYERRVLRPRGDSPNGMGNRANPYYYGLSYGHSFNELTTLSEEEFRKKIIEVESGLNSLNFRTSRQEKAIDALSKFCQRTRDGMLTPEELASESEILSQLEDDVRESPEETSILDAKARQIWELMDRVVLFKMVPMFLENM